MSVESLRERFDNFKDAEIRTVDIVSPTEVDITFALQDNAKDFDWITLTLHFYGVKDANIPDASKLPYIDMSEGASLLKNGTEVAFATLDTNNIKKIQDANLYILAESFKKSEGTF